MDVQGKWYLFQPGLEAAFGLLLGPEGAVIWDGMPWHQRYEVAAGHLILRDYGRDRMIFELAEGDVLKGKIEKYGNDQEGDEFYDAELRRDPGETPVA